MIDRLRRHGRGIRVYRRRHGRGGLMRRRRGLRHFIIMIRRRDIARRYSRLNGAADGPARRGNGAFRLFKSGCDYRYADFVIHSLIECRAENREGVRMYGLLHEAGRLIHFFQSNIGRSGNID